MRLVYGFVRQHRLPDDIADRKNVTHIGTHLNVNVDKTPIRHGNTRCVCANFFTIWRSTHGLQHQVVGLWRWRTLALKGDLNTLSRGTCRHRFGFQHDVVKTVCIHFLPHLHQIAVCALHQAIHHLDHVQACTQRRIHRAHFQANNAAAQNQHAFRD